MKRFVPHLCALTAALLLAAALPARAQEETTLEQVIAKNLEAKGGEAKLRALKSARVTGTMSMNGGQMQAPFTWEWKSPDKVRIEFTIQGMTGVQAYDGESGWMVMPFMGKTDPEAMPAEQQKEFEDQADFVGPFLDTEEKGYTLAYEGTEDVEGTPAYKVKVTNKHGDVTYLYLDQDYGLEIQSRSTRSVRGQEIESVTAIGDYKEVGGMMLPHSYDVKLKGAPMPGQTLTFDNIELDVDVADDRFAMPAAKATEESAGNEGGGR